jgi:hypothetical protein
MRVRRQFGSFSSIRRVSTTVGVNPASGDVALGLVFRGYDFRASASATQKSAGVGIRYGADLLPFPRELSTTFNSAAGGLQSMASDISAAPNNPLAWYKLHSDDAAAIGNAISVGQQIAKEGANSNRFGVGLRLNYAKETGLLAEPVNFLTSVGEREIPGSNSRRYVWVSVDNLPGVSEPSLSSITIYQLRVVLCGVSPLAGGVFRGKRHHYRRTPRNSSERLRWSGEHLHRFISMARPMGFAVWAASSSGRCSMGATFPFRSASRRALPL